MKEDLKEALCCAARKPLLDASKSQFSKLSHLLRKNGTIVEAANQIQDLFS